MIKQKTKQKSIVIERQQEKEREKLRARNEINTNNIKTKQIERQKQKKSINNAYALITVCSIPTMIDARKLRYWINRKCERATLKSIQTNINKSHACTQKVNK